MIPKRILLLAGLSLLPGVSPALEFPTEVFPAKGPLEIRFREARVLEAVGDPAAVKRYEELLGADFPTPDALHWSLARLLPPEQAEPHWRAVLSSETGSPFALDALEGLTDLCQKQGRLIEATEWLAQLLRTAPDAARRSRTLGRLMGLQELQGNSEAARATARALWVEYAAYPESRKAQGYFERAGVDPFQQFPLEDALKRGSQLLSGGSREEAVRTLSEVLRRLPPESALAPEAALKLGKSLYFLRRYGEALDALRNAASGPTQQEEARFYAARSLFGLDRGDEGAKAMVALALDYPQSAKAPDYLQQAVRVFGGRGMRAQAEEAGALLRQKYPRSGEAREALWSEGWTAYREGRFGEAVERFAAAAEGAERGWFRAQCRYWQGRALLRGGDSERGRQVLEGLSAEFPFGYYARLARSALAEKAGLSLTDPRGSEFRDLPVLLPQASDLDSGGDLSRAEAYLRLGLPDAARAVLRSTDSGDLGKARLLYWAEDFRGALLASRRSWLDWTAAAPAASSPLSREALAFPIAYPRSITEAAREAGVHPHLVLAVAHTESSFNPRAFSSAEARGLMQFIPSTAAQVAKAAGLKSFRVDDLYEPFVALRLGARHLRELLDRFGGDTILAVAAYNGGSGAVDRWRKQNGSQEPSAFVESIPYGETRRYVKKVLTALDAYSRLDPPGLWAAEAP